MRPKPRAAASRTFGLLSLLRALMIGPMACSARRRPRRTAASARACSSPLRNCCKAELMSALELPTATACRTLGAALAVVVLGVGMGRGAGVCDGDGGGGE